MQNREVPSFPDEGILSPDCIFPAHQIKAKDTPESWVAQVAVKC
jgi:hypothetical protein